MAFRTLDQIEALLARKAKVFIFHLWAVEGRAGLGLFVASQACRRTGRIFAFAVAASTLAQLDRLSILASLLHPLGWTPSILVANAVACGRGRRFRLRLALPSCLIVSCENLVRVVTPNTCNADVTAPFRATRRWRDTWHIALGTAAARRGVFISFGVAVLVGADLFAGVVIVDSVVSGVHGDDFVGTARIWRRVVPAAIPVGRSVAMGNTGPVAVRTSIQAHGLHLAALVQVHARVGFPSQRELRQP